MVVNIINMLTIIIITNILLEDGCTCSDEEAHAAELHTMNVGATDMNKPLPQALKQDIGDI